MADKAAENLGKALKNAKGAGVGIGLIGAAVAGGYAIMNSIFTGSDFTMLAQFGTLRDQLTNQIFEVYSEINTLSLVEAGHRAIMFNRVGGLGQEIYKEGLHFRVPWFQYPIIYDIRARPNQIRSPTGSKDLQMVNIGLRVLSRPDPNNLTKMYRTLGLNWEERVLPSICNEVRRYPLKQSQKIINGFDVTIISRCLKAWSQSSMHRS